MERLEFEAVKPLLLAFDQPAFVAEQNIVVFGNPAFQQLQISVGTPLPHFLDLGVQALAGTDEPVECTVAGVVFSVTVHPLTKGTLYLLHTLSSNIATQILAHTAKGIRAPLHSLYSALTCLCRQLDEYEDEKLQTYSAAALQGIYQLERLAENLDYLQQLRQGEYPLHLERTDIVNYLSELLQRAEDLLKYLNITLDVTLPEKLFNGNIDKTLVELVLWNLLANAAAHAQGGKIAVKAAHVGKQLRITVTDSGKGIEKKMMPYLYERYKMSMEKSIEQSGSGVGLSLIREAVRLHGGSMVLSVMADGRVSNLVTVRLDRTVNEEVHDRIRIGRGLSRGLVGLSGILPRETFDSRDIL